MEGISHMHDLNTAHVLPTLWGKLLHHLHSKWTERNSKAKTTKGRMANFEEFSQFVCKQAESANDTVFSEERTRRVPLNYKDNGHEKNRFPKREYNSLK